MIRMRAVIVALAENNEELKNSQNTIRSQLSEAQQQLNLAKGALEGTMTMLHQSEKAMKQNQLVMEEQRSMICDFKNTVNQMSLNTMAGARGSGSTTRIYKRSLTSHLNGLQVS